MPVDIVLSVFEKWRAKVVAFLRRQKEELGVSLVGEPNVMSETSGLRLSHWHWEGGGGGQSFPWASKASNRAEEHSYTHLLAAASASIVSAWDVAQGKPSAVFSSFKMDLFQIMCFCF